MLIIVIAGTVRVAGIAGYRWSGLSTLVNVIARVVARVGYKDFSAVVIVTTGVLPRITITIRCRHLTQGLTWIINDNG